MAEPILKLEDCCTWFDVTRGVLAKKQIVKAVNGVSLEVFPGETLGLVGESGCGKSTLGRTIVKVYTPVSGRILYKGQDINQMNASQEREFRKQVQMIFQDPYASLDPRMTVGEIIREPMDIHRLYTAQEREERVAELLRIVGLKPDHIRRYPHEFSGGQRQRIGIARTLALNPEFIVCDEPISALDVSIQAQVINILEDLQDKFNFTYLFISHDLAMVRHISDQVGVMYLGNLVEYAEVNELYDNMMHPYTKALISAEPVADPDKAEASQRIVLQGDVPSPINPGPGCPFRSRCQYAKEVCACEKPELKKINEKHFVACHLFE